MKSSSKAQPFRLAGAFGGGLLESLAERAFALRHLDTLYQALPEIHDVQTFLHRVLETFHVRYTVDARELGNIPTHGGTIVVANHPFGCIEGVILAALLREIRPDVKVMANYMLQRVPELRGLFIGVDPFGGREAARRNVAPLREAVRWVRGGGLLVVFPAGEVSHFRLASGAVDDPAWSSTIGRMVRLTGVPVVPMFFAGSNSLLFQLAGMVHPRLRTALLPRELINKRNSTIPLRIGSAIAYNRLQGFEHDDELAAYLRLRSYMLRDQARGERLKAAAEPLGRLPEMIAEGPAPGLLAAEVAALPESQRLERNGELQVLYARADQIPWLMQEIGRLREITFRATGEGTGRPLDLDLYDAYYLHLFVWNAAKGELVGAYRLGLADEIARRYGKKGLYTHSLFKYGRRLLEQLNPAIELGRSFVRLEYQRSYSPLLLLWKGIGQFVARHPQYKVLFGPVSISNEYESVSQRLLVEFLESNNYLPELARHVKPRRPFRRGAAWPRGRQQVVIRDLDGVSDLIAAIERDNKGVPILLKQYLKLGGRLLGFNVDDQFNDALDGLIMVDLSQTDPKVLQKYMGRENARQFLAGHSGEVALERAG